MLFISIQDFFDKAASAERLTPEQAQAYAARARAGEPQARERLIQSYLPVVAVHVKRAGKENQCLELVYRFMQVLEHEADQFDFSQGSELFVHRLRLRMRQALVGFIADK